MKPVIDTDREYGLVLEGGGAKGAYQIGVWKALIVAGVRIKGIAGASVGGSVAWVLSVSGTDSVSAGDVAEASDDSVV